MAKPSFAGVPPAGSLALIALLAACGSGSDGGPGPSPTTLAVAKASPSGDGQTGDPGQPLAAPLRIAATRGGTPEAGAPVTWTATGTGSLAPASGTTDANGIASAAWTLGQEQGTQSAQAVVSGAVGSPVIFSATAGSGGGAPLAATVILREAGGTRYDPNAVTIGAGGTVTWVWGDGQHDVTSTGLPSFQSSGPPNEPPRQYAVTFSSAGVYNYACTVHPGMSGRVTVQ
jgi:plastocyanin